MRNHLLRQMVCLALCLGLLGVPLTCFADSGELPGVSFEIENQVLLRANFAARSAAPIQMLTLPEAISEIAEEAFRGTAAIQAVQLGKNVAVIGPYAFADCDNLTAVYIDSDAEIDPTAFDGSGSVVIHTDSKKVQQWATDNQVAWEPITPASPELPAPGERSQPIELPAL